jgi:phospholipase/lecithinase/hemolysin
MLTSLLAAACAVPQLASAQASFSRIVVFGTSLSDPGNAFALAGGTNTPARAIIARLLATSMRRL